MVSKLLSYQEYLEIIEGSQAIKMHEYSGRLIDRYRSSEYNLSSQNGAIFLVEFTSQKYIYVSDAIFTILGYSINEFKEMSLTQFQSTIHPSDFAITNKIIFPYNLSFLEKFAPENWRDFIFSYNYRVLNKLGKYITALQRFSLIPSNKKTMPYGMIGVGYDITHFKNDLSVVQTIEKTAIQNGELVNDLVFKKIYPVYDYDISNYLSKKELEVLEQMSKGFGSKQIADRMNISINTVHNHRKNMLSKTNCKSSSELISFAIKHGLL